LRQKKKRDPRFTFLIWVVSVEGTFIFIKLEQCPYLSVQRVEEGRSKLVMLGSRRDRVLGRETAGMEKIGVSVIEM
jgi:hypothetical protein